MESNRKSPTGTTAMMRSRLLLRVAFALAVCGAPAGAGGFTHCRTIEKDHERLACYDNDLCRAIEKDQERLACYDNRAERLEIEEFGNLPETKRASNSVRVNKQALSATALSIEQDVYGKLRIRLDNGQLWRTLNTDRQLNLKPGDEIKIRRGFGGSYNLSPVKNKTRVKVRRVE